MFLAPIQAHTQQLEYITLNKMYGEAKAAASNELNDSTCNPILIIHSRTKLGNDSLLFDMETGKATGWIYFFHSATTDSGVYVLVTKYIDGPDSVDLSPVENVSSYMDTTPLTVPWLDSPLLIEGIRNTNAYHQYVSTRSNVVLESFAIVQDLFIARFSASADTLQFIGESTTGDIWDHSILTSISPIATPEAFSISHLYPNPILQSQLSTLTLSCSSTASTVLSIYIYSITGSLSHSSRHEILPGPQDLSLSLPSTLDRGPFYIVATNGDHITSTMFLIE
jgi:hypothetical protein